MTKIKIAFMAPEGKGGPYYIYKDILEYFTIHYSQQIQIDFFSTKKDWLLLHIKKYDIILSTIPFLFLPLGTKKFIFNLHGNYKIERKGKGLGVKLLYLVENNFRFSDTILVSSDFLPDKLGFGKRYKNKIVKIPLHINGIQNLNSKSDSFPSEIKFLTVSSFEFIQKALGILDVAKQLKNIKGYTIKWTIIAGGNQENKKIILKEIKKLDLSDDIQINWIDSLPYEELKKHYQNTDIYIYGTRLETRGKTIMEAMSFGLPVILLDYELWRYIYPEEIITDNVDSLLQKIITNHSFYQNLSLSFVKNYSLESVMNSYYKLFILK